MNERRGITADTALRLERYFGMSADFWLGLRKDYDLQTARQAAGQRIADEINRAGRGPHNAERIAYELHFDANYAPRRRRACERLACVATKGKSAKGTVCAGINRRVVGDAAQPL